MVRRGVTNMNKFINFPCIVEGVSSRKDRTLKIILGSQEMSPDSSAVLLSLANQSGHCYLSPNALQEADLVIPKDEDMPQTKTPSQRLRARMFVYFTQHLQKPKEEFKAWYDQQLDKIGDGYLERMQT